MFKNFFKNPKLEFRVVGFGEPIIEWNDKSITTFSIVFYENDNGERKYIVAGGDLVRIFNNTPEYAHCETWRHTGLLPKWAKDPMAEKLSR